MPHRRDVPVFGTSAPAAVCRTRRGQPESAHHSPNRIWQRNGGKGMGTRSFSIALPLPITPLPPFRRPIGTLLFGADAPSPFKCDGPCYAVSVLGFSSRRRLRQTGGFHSAGEDRAQHGYAAAAHARAEVHLALPVGVKIFCSRSVVRAAGLVRMFFSSAATILNRPSRVFLVT